MFDIECGPRELWGRADCSGAMYSIEYLKKVGEKEPWCHHKVAMCLDGAISLSSEMTGLKVIL